MNDIAVIGIFGAGQLGKMLAEAAGKLGFKTHVYAPDKDPIAASASTYFTQADYDDLSALSEFADSVDVITLEFENLPVVPISTIHKAICPSLTALETCQHRIREKSLAQSLGIATAPYLSVSNIRDLKQAIKTIGTPGILKTCTLGYDGKGQWKITDGDNLPHVKFSEDIQYIYEGFVAFEREISVIVARSANGDMECFEPVENVHKNHILHTTTAPATLTPEVSAKAMEMTRELASALEVVGLLAVEMFVTASGDVLMNEMAPRPHNSGHWTLDGCNVSQFEQAIRAVAGMPLVTPQRTAAKVVMTNLIGEEIHALDGWKKQGAHIHTYGKKETRPGRKMGHVTQTFQQ